MCIVWRLRVVNFPQADLNEACGGRCGAPVLTLGQAEFLRDVLVKSSTGKIYA
jgi:hypothetical protein